MSRLIVKVGGRVAESSAGPILALARENEVCVVHGAGPQISLEMARAGIPVEFVRGRRVTTLAGLEIVRQSMEAVNAALCESIGDRAVPIFGNEVGFRGGPLGGGSRLRRRAVRAGGLRARRDARGGKDPCRRPTRARRG